MQSGRVIISFDGTSGQELVVFHTLLLCSVSPGASSESLEDFTENISYWFVEGQTHFGILVGDKRDNCHPQFDSSQCRKSKEYI